MLVHLGNALEDEAGAGLVVAPNSGQPLLVRATVAEGAGDEEIDAVGRVVQELLLQAVVDAAHQRFVGHDQAVAVHVSDAAEIAAVLYDLVVPVSSLLSHSKYLPCAAEDELGPTLRHREELLDVRHLGVDVVVVVLVAKLSPNLEL